MSKYCGNCGAEMDDDVRFCGMCGSRFDDADMPVQKSSNIGKWVKAAVALVIVFGAVFTGVKIVRQNTGPNGFVKKVMKSYLNYDIDGLLNMSSNMYYYAATEDYGSNYFKNAVGRTLDEIESTFGNSYKVSYEIGDIYDASARSQEELLNNIQRYMPQFDLTSIDKICVAPVRLTIKGSNRTISKDIKLTITRENKAWKVLYIE